MAQHGRVGRSGQRPVRAEVVQHDLAGRARAEPEVLGPEEARIQHRCRPQHDRDDAADQRPARRRTRSRSTSSADQAQPVSGRTRKLHVSLQPSTWVFWLFANNDPKVSSVTSNKQWQQAVRYALDYKSILSVAGPGAIQAPGLIPSMFLGSLPQKDAIKQDVAKAKAALHGVGRQASQQVTLAVPVRPDDQRRPVHDAWRRRCRRTSRPRDSTSSSRGRRRRTG